MLIPFCVLIITATVMFPVNGWRTAAAETEGSLKIFSASWWSCLGQSFREADASASLFYAIVFTLFFMVVYYMARGLMKISHISDSLIKGAGTMMPALIILTLAWTIGGIIKNSPADGGLGLSAYLAHAVSGNLPVFIVPVTAFLLSCIIAFSTGTSWGTMAIMIPITMPIAVAFAGSQGLDQASELNMVLYMMSAAIGGAIFGDHSSPISDTTILSATGAGCPTLEHVATQMPYASLVAVCCGIGYFTGALAGMNLSVALITALVLFLILFRILYRLTVKSWRKRESI